MADAETAEELDSTPAADDVVATQDAPAETETPAEPPKVVFDDAQQAKVNEIAARGAEKTRKANEALAASQAQIAQLQSQIPQPVEPQIPDMPGEFDDDFQEKIAVRDKAIQDQAVFRNNQNLQVQQLFANEQAQQQAFAQQQHDVEQGFLGNAKTLGVSDEVLNQSVAVLVNGGLGGEVGNHIMGMKQGPNVANYLAANPEVMDQVAGMAPLQAAAFIQSEVLPKATPKPVDPGIEPVETLSGATVPSEGDDGYKYS